MSSQTSFVEILADLISSPPHLDMTMGFALANMSPFGQHRAQISIHRHQLYRSIDGQMIQPNPMSICEFSIASARNVQFMRRFR